MERHLTLVKTDRLVIRELTYRDKEAYHAIFSDPSTSEFEDFDPITWEDADDDIEDILASYCLLEILGPRAYAVSIEKKMAGVIYVDRRKYDEAYIGYHFLPAFHGQGYAREALQALSTHLYEKGVRHLLAKVHPDNKRSVKLLRDLDFDITDSNGFVKLKGERVPEHTYTLTMDYT